jgi:uncharacterized protein
VESVQPGVSLERNRPHDNLDDIRPSKILHRSIFSSKHLRMRPLAFMLSLYLCGPVVYGEQTQTDYELEMHVKVPLRDGVRLDATLYKPTPSPGLLPVILMLSPYPDSTMEPRGSYFASRGYVYAWVDVRGRGDSEGVFNPFVKG